MDLGKLVKTYIKIRDARAEKKKAFELEDGQLKEHLGKIEAVLLGHLNTTGGESVRTDEGTFYKQEEITPTGSDWDRLYAWVKEEDAFDALERRIKKTFIKEYMETHEGALPPGVSVHREYVVRVRRS
jgi:hypothetical protein